MKQRNLIAFQDGLRQDIRYGVRMMLRAPGQSLIILVTLALGIAGNCAVFSIIDAVLLKPLPFPDSHQLVSIGATSDETRGEPARLSVPEFIDLSGAGDIFSRPAAYTWGYANLSGVDEPQRLVGGKVTSSFFTVLRSNPVLGRAFSAQEDQFGNHRVALISYELWQHSFGETADVLNKTIRLDDETYTVIGVMSPGFNFPFYGISVWRPLAPEDEEKNEAKREDRSWYTLARLKPGVTIEQAQTHLNLLTARLKQAHPEAYPNGLRLTVTSKHEEMVRPIRPVLLTLFVGIGLVLLIGCANVANIVLARVTSRRHEIATRIVLGADRSRLFRQLLTENLVISVIGAAIGMLLTQSGIRLFQSFGPTDTPFLETIGVNHRVIGYAIGLTLLISVILSLFPILSWSTPNLSEPLKEQAKSAGGRSRIAHHLLLISQIALSLILLVGAGLLIKSFRNLQLVSVGFEPANRLSMRLVLPIKSYPTPAQRRAFFQQLLERINKLPGFDSVGLVTSLPLANINHQIRFGRAEEISNQGLPYANYLVVSPNYFKVMGIPLLKGQGFQDDGVKWLPEVIVNKALASRMWPGEDVIGKQIKLYGGSLQSRPARIIGVVADIKHNGLHLATSPEIYMSFLNASTPTYYLGAMFLVVHSTADTAGIISAVRSEVRKLDNNQPVFNIYRMEDRIAASLFPRRSSMLLLSTSAAIAIILSFIGAFGLMSYYVTHRTPEIAIRMALGAGVGDVRKLIIGQALRLASAGIIIGILGAFVSARLMRGMLFGVRATDPLVFILTPLLLLGVVLSACYAPIRKALKVDPLVVLRSE
jgi:putative ABC transport system permease protein